MIETNLWRPDMTILKSTVLLYRDVNRCNYSISYVLVDFARIAKPDRNHQNQLVPCYHPPESSPERKDSEEPR